MLEAIRRLILLRSARQRAAALVKCLPRELLLRRVTVGRAAASRAVISGISQTTETMAGLVFASLGRPVGAAPGVHQCGVVLESGIKFLALLRLAWLPAPAVREL